MKGHGCHFSADSYHGYVRKKRRKHAPMHLTEPSINMKAKK